MNGKDVAYYRSLPYTRFATVEYDQAGSPRWVAYVRELPECRAEGQSYRDALAMLDAAFAEYVESKLAAGEAIGEPAWSR